MDAPRWAFQWEEQHANVGSPENPGNEGESQCPFQTPSLGPQDLHEDQVALVTRSGNYWTAHELQRGK